MADALKDNRHGEQYFILLLHQPFLFMPVHVAQKTIECLQKCADNRVISVIRLPKVVLFCDSRSFWSFCEERWMKFLSNF